MTVKKRDLFDEPTGMYSRRVMEHLSSLRQAGTIVIKSIPNMNSSQRPLTPVAYGRHLLDSLSMQHLAIAAATDDATPEALWAQSGAMWLSGHADGPPRACSAALASCARGAWLALSALSAGRLDPQFAAHHLLGERAAIAGLQRRGRISAGGACQLLDTRDGVIALNLAREEDRDLLPAWLQMPASDCENYVEYVRRRPTQLLLERGQLLGLAVAPVVAPQPCSRWYNATGFIPETTGRSKLPLVIDLSALWAGPLCAQLLSQCGARVIKVESSHRPDGARFGSTDFYHLMNAGKESVALDIKSERGKKQLHALLETADMVIESSRPRALEQMGIDANTLLARQPGKVWLSITGYGRAVPMRDWIAYGDDAGVAAGLSWLMGGERDDPVFCGDAIADPITGLHAAVLALSSWYRGGGVLLDIPLHDVIAYCVSAGTPTGHNDVDTAQVTAALPRARPVTAQAADLGADTERILREFSL